MRQDPEETGSEPRAVQERGMQPGEDESETQGEFQGMEEQMSGTQRA